MGNTSSLPVEENLSDSPETRILPCEFDPRSPSEGITRTPIEVICTPKSKALKAVCASSSCDTPVNSKIIVQPVPKRILQNSPTLLKNEEPADIKSVSSHDVVADNSTNRVIDALVEQENGKESTELAMEVTENVVRTAENDLSSKLTYLETDIDEVFTKGSHVEHPRVRQLRNSKMSTTPACESINSSLANDTVNTDTLSARIDNLSFTDVSFDDPSMFVSDIENEPNSDSRCPTATIKEWLITVESDGHSIIPFDILGDADEQITQKKNCVTPDRKIKLTNKERTPLGCLVQNKVHEPVKETSDMKKKQWRSIQEERLKRGLSAPDENTPPALRKNPFDHTASAPGKLMRHRRAIDWDRSNVLRK